MKKIIKVLDSTTVNPPMFNNLLTAFAGSELLSMDVDIIENAEEQKIIFYEQRDPGFIGLNLVLFISSIAVCYLCGLGYRIEVDPAGYNKYNFDALFCLISGILFALLATVNFLILLREVVYISRNKYVFDRKNQTVTYPVGLFKNRTVNFSDCTPDLVKDNLFVKVRIGANYRITFHRTSFLRFELRFWSKEVAMELWSTIVRYMEGGRVE